MPTKTVEGVVFTFHPSEDPQLEDSEWEADVAGIRVAVQVLENGRYGPNRFHKGKILYARETKSLKNAMRMCVALAREAL